MADFVRTSGRFHRNTHLQVVGFILLTPQLAKKLWSSQRIQNVHQELAYFSLVTAEWLVSKGPFVWEKRVVGGDIEATAKVTQRLGKTSGRNPAMRLLLPRYALLLAVILPIAGALITPLPLWAGLSIAYVLWMVGSSRWFIGDIPEVETNASRNKIKVTVSIIYLFSPVIYLPFLLYWTVVVTGSVILSWFTNFLSVRRSLRILFTIVGIVVWLGGTGLELASALVRS